MQSVVEEEEELLLETKLGRNLRTRKSTASAWMVDEISISHLESKAGMEICSYHYL